MYSYAFTSDEMKVGVLYEETCDGTRTKFVHNEPYKYAEAEQFPPQFRSGQYSYKIWVGVWVGVWVWVWVGV